MAYRRPTGEIVLRRFTTESDFISFVSPLGSVDRTSVAIVEDVPAYVSAATSNASSFKLGYNFGFEVGALRAMRVPVHLITPKKWQAGLRGLKPKMGTTERKRVLKDNAIRLYPLVDGITNATADALLLLDWHLNQFTGADGSSVRGEGRS